MLDIPLLDGYTALELFWIVCILYNFFTLTLSFLTKAVDKTKDREQPDEQQLSFYEFRERPTWFHFIGLTSTMMLTWVVVGVSCLDRESYEWTYQFINATTQTANQTPTTGIVDINFACLLLVLYHGFRFYESVYVVMYSGRNVTNPVSMMMSVVFQVAMALSVIADGPNLADEYSDIGCLSMADILYLNVKLVIFVLMFFVILFFHRQSHIQLANLRRNRFGHATTTAYKKPVAVGLFTSVSSPHLLCEVLAYAVLGGVLGCGAHSWWLMTAAVFLSACERAYRANNWYLSKYEDYPRNTKAIVPYLF